MPPSASSSHSERGGKPRNIDKMLESLKRYVQASGALSAHWAAHGSSGRASLPLLAALTCNFDWHHGSLCWFKVACTSEPGYQEQDRRGVLGLQACD